MMHGIVFRHESSVRIAGTFPLGYRSQAPFYASGQYAWSSTWAEV